MITISFLGRALLPFSFSFAYISHHICLVLAAAPPQYPFLSISLNSLDLAGVRLLSPRDSQILQTVAGADDNCAGDTTKLKEELDEDRVRCVVSFPADQ